MSAPRRSRKTVTAEGGAAARRSYGSGRVYVRKGSAGRETFYGSWWTNGRRVNRRLGVKRVHGSREGLTTAQAEAQLRRLMGEVSPTAPQDDRLDVTDAGRRYRYHLAARAVVWRVNFSSGRSIGGAGWTIWSVRWRPAPRRACASLSPRAEGRAA
jgi:hypothetical protein